MSPHDVPPPASELGPQVFATVAGGSNGLALMYAGRVISGIGIGGISAVAPAYISECAPKTDRGRITGLFSIMVCTFRRIHPSQSTERSGSLRLQRAAWSPTSSIVRRLLTLCPFSTDVGDRWDWYTYTQRPESLESTIWSAGYTCWDHVPRFINTQGLVSRPSIIIFLIIHYSRSRLGGWRQWIATKRL